MRLVEKLFVLVGGAGCALWLWYIASTFIKSVFFNHYISNYVM